SGACGPTRRALPGKSVVGRRSEDGGGAASGRGGTSGDRGVERGAVRRAAELRVQSWRRSEMDDLEAAERSPLRRRTGGDDAVRPYRPHPGGGAGQPPCGRGGVVGGRGRDCSAVVIQPGGGDPAGAARVQAAVPV